MAAKRVIVVGCGSIGRRHARLLVRRPDVAVELCDVNPENVRRSLEEVGHRPIYGSLDQALASRPEIVVIATPHALHADQAIRALRAGAHVLCEKPMSDTLADARRMVDAAKASASVFSVGFNLHFHPATRQIRDMIRSGELGQVVHVHWHIGTYRTLLNSTSRYQATVAGALFLDYVHQPDLLHWWLGRKPTTVYASGLRAGSLELQSTPNVAAVTLEYDRHLLATIHLNYIQHPERATCEVIGDKKWLFFDMKANLIRIGACDDESETENTFAFQRDSMYEAEHQAFLDAIDGKRSPESPAEDAIVSQEIVEAAIDSWRRQRPVRL